jgi:hypothetical protein
MTEVQEMLFPSEDWLDQEVKDMANTKEKAKEANVKELLCRIAGTFQGKKGQP